MKVFSLKIFFDLPHLVTKMLSPLVYMYAVKAKRNKGMKNAGRFHDAVKPVYSGHPQGQMQLS